jgi:DNA-binding NtrC family response regulator
MQHIYRLMHRVNKHLYPVLILGEEGTEKEVLARSLHSLSARAQEPFVHVHCAALARTMAESELLGYTKGAFLGAAQSKPGLLRAAGRGTLFLDDVAELPESVQTKLFRVLQEGQFRHIGSTEHVTFEARVMAASASGLAERVRQGEFREDLYFRLNATQFQLPPLRERKRDIPILADFFLEQYGDKKESPWKFSRAALECLLANRWPGNIRELEETVREALRVARHPIVDATDLPAEMRGSPTSPASEAVEAGEFERLAILTVWKEAGGDKTVAAHLLGIAKSTLSQKLKSYGV